MTNTHAFQGFTTLVFQFLIFVLVPGASHAGKPIEDCPVNLLAMVEVCDANDKCVWKNYCAVLGFGVDVDDSDPRTVNFVAPVTCVDLCNQRHDSLQAREECYESCGVPPVTFGEQILRLPPRPPICSMDPWPDSSPIGICRGSTAVLSGIADSSDSSGSPGLSVGLSLEYQLTRTFALELFVGRDEFDGGSGSEPADLSIDHLSLNGKYFFRQGRVRPYAALGFGLYDFDPGSTENGVNAAVGLRYQVSGRATAELVGSYHVVNADDFDFEYLTIAAGLRFHF